MGQICLTFPVVLWQVVVFAIYFHFFAHLPIMKMVDLTISNRLTGPERKSGFFVKVKDGENFKPQENRAYFES